MYGIMKLKWSYQAVLSYLFKIIFLAYAFLLEILENLNMFWLVLVCRNILFFLLAFLSSEEHVYFILHCVFW